MTNETDTTLSDDIDCEEGHVTQYPNAKSLILWFLAMVISFMVLGGLISLIIHKYSKPTVDEQSVPLEIIRPESPVTYGPPAQSARETQAETIRRSVNVSAPRIIRVGRHTQKSFLVPGGGESPIIEIQDAATEVVDFMVSDQRFIEEGKADPFTVRYYGTGDSLVGEYRYPEDGVDEPIKTNRFSLVARGGRATKFVVSTK